MKFQGKDWGTGNGVDLNLYDFGARRYDPSIGRWLSQDPLSEKYYNHTPYLFCAGNPLNNFDPLGKAPIYSTTGVFLGTDDRGLKGIYIVMEKDDFTQGMLHKDALKKQLMDIESNVRNSIEDHYATLSSRPDYDGYLTKEEADKWWLEGSGNPLYVDISEIDLPDITTESFPEDNSVIYKNFIWGLSNTGKTYGTLRIELLDKNTGEVLIGNQSFVDEYDFSMQKGRPLRNMATKIGRPGKEGKDFYIIGYGKTRIPVKKKKSVKK